MFVSPLQAYQAQLNEAGFQSDPAQQQGLQALEALYQTLFAKKKTPSSTKGVYLWGDVGRGKTFLMNLFCESMPEGQALRMHFHSFMSRIYQELGRFTGQPNPLKKVAKQLSTECRVRCFDEFFVSDIADAMLIGGLMEALFEEGILLVATSNIPIHLLFQSQLQKERFQPSIDLLKKHLVEVHLDGKIDHRLTAKPLAQTYYLDDHNLSVRFAELVGSQSVDEADLIISGRPVSVRGISDNVGWFDFSVLCEGVRSAYDYIELAKRFDHILLSCIPELSNDPYEQIKARGTEDGAVHSKTGDRHVALGVHDNAVRRFISLVDECYDRSVILHLSAAVPLDDLYKNGALLFEFKRTYSRITEMQTTSYQNRAIRLRQKG